MVNERRTERASSFFTRPGRKGTGIAPKQPASFVKQVESERLSAQLKLTSGGTIQPRSIMANKMPASGHRRTFSLDEGTSKTTTQFPPIPTMSLHTPRKSKVTFLQPSQPTMDRRRMSVPEESLNRLNKSILKKRHSVSVDYKEPAPQSEPVDISVLCALPWERELYLPPITQNGTLIYTEEDGSLPPMLRRLSNVDTYQYSQEFLEALNDLKNRPASSKHSDNAAMRR